MPHTSRKEIYEKRFKGYSPDNLPRKREKERLVELLKRIGDGVSRKDLFSHFKKKEGEWSERYFYVIRNYAEEIGFIDIPSSGEISLTDKGKKFVYSMLEELRLPSPARVELEQDGGQRGKIALEYENEDMSKFECWEKLLLYLRSYIKKQDPFRVQSPGGKLKYEPLTFDEDEFDDDVQKLFRDMLEFYEEKSDIPPRVSRFGIPAEIHKDLYMDLKRSNHPSTRWTERYPEFWRERKEKARGEAYEKRRKMVEEISDDEMEKIIEREEILDKETFDPNDYAPIFLLRSLEKNVRENDIGENLGQKIHEETFNADKYIPIFLQEALEKQNVRDWISRRLKEDSNFFMPKWFWQRLGFWEEVSPQSTEASHPYDLLIKEPPFAKFSFEMWRDFASALAREKDRGEDGTYRALRHAVNKYKTRDEFYRSFFALRKALRKSPQARVGSDLLRGDWISEKELKMLEPVEEAFWREIQGENVKLKLVYTHLSIEDEDHKYRVESIDEAKEKIREEKYDKAGMYCFSIKKETGEIIEGLNKDEIVSELRKKFEEKDYTLSEDASATVEEENEIWNLGRDISYPDYRVKKVKRKLNVYRILKI